MVRILNFWHWLAKILFVGKILTKLVSVFVQLRPFGDLACPFLLFHLIELFLFLLFSLAYYTVFFIYVSANFKKTVELMFSLILLFSSSDFKLLCSYIFVSGSWNDCLFDMLFDLFNFFWFSAFCSNNLILKFVYMFCLGIVGVTMRRFDNGRDSANIRFSNPAWVRVGVGPWVLKVLCQLILFLDRVIVLWFV